jgi:uncharacterized protein (TIGR00266 family)
MQEKIIGTVMPVLELMLDQGEEIVAEAGELSWISSSIDLHTSTQLGGAKGIFGVLKRAVGGGGLFMTKYTASRGPGLVAFASKVPGHILPIDMHPGSTLLVHRHGYLAGTTDVEISVGFQRSLGAGVFGGEGFVLQKVGGTGRAWIELDGEVVSYDLRPGENLRVSPGHVGMFQDTVTFDISTVPGIRNVLFGGDGLFLASLTGPGRVWLQSMPLANLAHALAHFLPGRSESSSSNGNTLAAGAAGSMLGAVLGGLTGDRVSDS